MLLGLLRSLLKHGAQIEDHTPDGVKWDRAKSTTSQTLNFPALACFLELAFESFRTLDLGVN